ncbi:MAG TPA: TetR/AcrR family transcriptional regulator [Mycobacterium sp.]|nr:TetR/AcrR family transcriptional regulator [Mycobacterium sp.]
MTASESHANGATDKRAELTRRHILRAAAHQFAHRSYSQVSLDDILADAEVTKGAMYFHFRSKHALALALIDEQTDTARAAANQIVARRLSALETLVDITYLVAVQDLGDELARAALNLIEGVGRADGVQGKLLGQWADSFAAFLQRAIHEGDVRADIQPAGSGRLLAALYMGLRQTSDLSDSETFLTDLQRSWLTLLPGLTPPDRVGYMTEFIKRRTALALHTVPLRADTL